MSFTQEEDREELSTAKRNNNSNQNLFQWAGEYFSENMWTSSFFFTTAHILIHQKSTRFSDLFIYLFIPLWKCVYYFTFIYIYFMYSFSSHLLLLYFRLLSLRFSFKDSTSFALSMHQKANSLNVENVQDESGHRIRDKKSIHVFFLLFIKFLTSGSIHRLRSSETSEKELALRQVWFLSSLWIPINLKISCSWASLIYSKRTE